MKGFENIQINWQGVWDSLVGVCIDIAVKLIVAALVLVVGRLIIKAVMKKMRKSRVLARSEATAKKFLEAFVNIALNVSLIVLVVAIMGVPMASIVAVIGSVGVAISLAVQGTLSNLASGIMMLVFRPFKLDDFIETGSFIGTVTDMGVFYTTITTPDNKTVVIPNSSLTSSVLVNYSTKDTRRLDVEVNLEYGSDINRIREVANSVIARHGEILTDIPPVVFVTELRDSSIRASIRVWCKNNDYWPLKFGLNEEITNELAKSGISVAYNKMNVTIDQGNGKADETK